VVKFFRRENDDIVRFSRDQEISTASQTVATIGSRPKSARTSPQHLVHTVPEIIQIGSLSVEL